MPVVLTVLVINMTRLIKCLYDRMVLKVATWLRHSNQGDMESDCTITRQQSGPNLMRQAIPKKAQALLWSFFRF